VSAIDAGANVSPCETIVYQATVGFRGGADCAFEGGTITITTSDGVVHDVTPIGGVPKIGGTGGIDTVDSRSRATGTGSDIVAGKVTAGAAYGPGTSGRR